MRAIAVSLFIVALTGASQADTPAGNAAAGEIRVEFTGLRSESGQVRCGLYPSEDGFPKKPAFKAASAVKEGRAICTFPGRPAGTYAVAAYHDENGNGKLDTNLVGIPKEGTGFSNGARPRMMGPPAFSAASFAHGGAVTTVSIRIVY
jgi:uncharacterized protein (DUF2141 family)